MKKNGTTLFDYNSEDIRSGNMERPEDVVSEKKPGLLSRRSVYIIAVAVVSVILAVVMIFAVIDRVNEGLVMELEVGDVIPYTMSDGDYSGTYTSNDLAAAVTVTIESGYITNITLDGFTGIDTARAQRVFEAVIYAQSLITYDEEVGTQPTDVILLLAIRQAMEGGNNLELQ